MKLTKKRQKYVSERDDPLLVGDKLSYPAGIMSRYTQELQSLSHTMAVDYQRQIDRLWEELGSQSMQGTQDASLASQVTILLNQLSAKWRKIFVDRSRKLANGMINQVSRYSEKSVNQSLKTLSGGLTIKAPILPDSVKEAIKASTKLNVSLIRNIQEQFANRVESAVLSSIQTGGAGTKQIYDELIKIDGMTQRRAKNIADDQTRKVNTALNTARMQSSGVKQFRWIHSYGGNEPRELHVEYDGQIFDYDNPPIIDERTGERGMPGQAINCHPGDSIIDFTDGCNKIYRRMYSGELLSLVTDDGVVLQATPNHPILTHRGWVAIKDIDLGDYVVNSSRQCVQIGEANIQNSVTTFAEFFDSAFDLIGVSRANVGGSTFEFHGDCSDNNVDVIDVASDLPLILSADGIKVVAELVLAYADNILPPTVESFDGSSHRFLMSIGSSSERRIGSFASLLSLLRGEAGRAKQSCLSLSSYLDATIIQDSSNYISADVELLSDFIFWNAGNVEGRNQIIRQLALVVCRWLSENNGEAISAEMLGEKIGIAFDNGCNFLEGSVSVKKFSRVQKKIVSIYSGHIYNLENKNNWYSANGIVTHNCRCVAQPILSFGNNDTKE